MGTVLSRLSRPIKNWNVENRAHKAISQEKRKAAPPFGSMQKQIELVDKFDPEYKKASKIKNKELDNYLKNIYVSSNSFEVKEINSRSDPNRPLPKERTLQEGFEYGFYEPTEVKVGKITLRKAIELITKRAKDPEKYTVLAIASEYKLDPKLVANILEYYKIYQVTNADNNIDDMTPVLMPISLKSGIRVKQFVLKKDFIADNLVPSLNLEQKKLKEK